MPFWYKIHFSKNKKAANAEFSIRNSSGNRDLRTSNRRHRLLCLLRLVPVGLYLGPNLRQRQVVAFRTGGHHGATVELVPKSGCRFWAIPMVAVGDGPDAVVGDTGRDFAELDQPTDF